LLVGFPVLVSLGVASESTKPAAALAIAGFWKSWRDILGTHDARVVAHALPSGHHDRSDGGGAEANLFIELCEVHFDGATETHAECFVKSPGGIFGELASIGRETSLISPLPTFILPRMAMPEQPVTLDPEQIAQLNKRLSETRHNVNNFLALIVAATELIRRKPETTTRMVDTMAEQPQKIMEEFQKFSKEFEAMLRINR
jgi:hypothetical protein